MDAPASMVTVIIVNWNTCALLRGCLTSLIGQTQSELAIWVVDNASTDGSAAMVKQDFPAVHLLECEQNLGFAAANNLAIRAAAPSRYILLLNPDTRVLAGAVDALVAYLDSHPQTGAAGVQLLNPDGTPQRSFDHFYTFTGSFWRNLLVTSLLKRTPGTVRRPNGEARPVDWLLGACVMLRRQALRQIGLLDERFFMYGEETDLQWRMRRAGWEIVLLPHAHIIHYGGQSSRQAPLKMMIQEYYSRYLLVARQTSRVTQVLYVAKAIVALCIWCVYWGTRSLIHHDRPAREKFGMYRVLLQYHLSPRFYARPR